MPPSRPPHGWTTPADRGAPPGPDDGPRSPTARGLPALRPEALFEHVIDAVFILDTEGHLIHANPQAGRLLGYDVDELAGLTVSDMVVPDEHDQATRRQRQILSGEPLPLYRRRLRRKSGETVHVEISAALVKDEAGHPLYVQTVCRDITERVLAHQALEASEDRYRQLVEKLPAVVWMSRGLPDDDDLIFISPQIEALTGYAPEAWLAEPSLWKRLLHPDDRNDVVRRFDTAVRTRTPVACEYRLMHRDGSVRWVRDVASFVRDRTGGAQALQGILLDITERRRLDEERTRAGRLESVGLLAGGIAHDFNNFLTGILGHLSLALMECEPESVQAQLLRQAERATGRARALTQQLLGLARGGHAVRKVQRVDGLLKETVLFALSGSSVRCTFEIAADLHPVEIDEGQVAQVLENLVINATQAMPEGGNLRVMARNVQVTHGGTSDHLAPGPHVTITLEDDGPGMPPEVLERVFDPYFTTKQEGNGLGLTISYAIVSRHDGSLAVSSEPGRGTRCSITLPASPEARVPSSEGRAAADGLKGRVLVMDDDADVRDVLGRMLARLGMEVDGAEEGARAVALWDAASEQGRPYDLVITDLTVRGGQGGLETLHQLRARDPDVRVVVSSGYSDDPAMAGPGGQGFDASLVKPYRIEDLRETIVHVLCTRPS